MRNYINIWNTNLDCTIINTNIDCIQLELYTFKMYNYKPT